MSTARPHFTETLCQQFPPLLTASAIVIIYTPLRLKARQQFNNEC